MLLNSQVAILSNQVVANRFGKNARVKSVPPVFLATLLFVVLVFQLWVRINIIEQGYELERVRKAALSRDMELRALNLRFAYLSRPSFLVARAQSNLGMETTPRERMRQLVLPMGDE